MIFERIILYILWIYLQCMFLYFKLQCFCFVYRKCFHIFAVAVTIFYKLQSYVTLALYVSVFLLSMHVLYFCDFIVLALFVDYDFVCLLLQLHL